MNRRPTARHAAAALFMLGIALHMLLSAPTLAWLGIPYDAPYGPMIAKLHPGGYVLALAWFMALVSCGNPLGAFIAQMRREPALAVYFGCMVTVFFWSIARHGTAGAAYIVQTLWMPAIALFTLRLLGTEQHRRTVRLVMVLLGVNAGIALIEYAFKARLVPLDEALVDTDFFRPNGLLGHPLLNAKVTMALLPAVSLLPWSLAARLALAALLVAAALAFGGRSAVLIGLAVYGIWGTLVLLRRLAQRRIDTLRFTGGTLAAVAGAGALAGVMALTGLGDRIVGNLVWDNSASVRGRVWDAFDHLRGLDGWLGMAPAQIDRVALAMGLDPRFEAIENFWIYAFLQFGVVGFVPFAVGLLGFFWHIFRTASPAMRAGTLTFFLAASTANSLSSKSISLLLVSVVACGSAALCRSSATSRRGPAVAPRHGSLPATLHWAR